MEHEIVKGSGRFVRIDKSMRGDRQTTLLLILITLVAASITALTVGTAEAAPGAGTGASFVVQCNFNGVFVADPKALTHHEHVESGARPFDNSITADSVRANETSCFDAGDKTAYWSPLLYENSGTALIPDEPIAPVRGSSAGCAFDRSFPACGVVFSSDCGSR